MSSVIARFALLRGAIMQFHVFSECLEIFSQFFQLYPTRICPPQQSTHHSHNHTHTQVHESTHMHSM